MASAETSPRRGSLLLVVAGISVLLVTTSVAILGRLRADAGANRLVMQDAQCRLALTAALHHLLETSRIGWSSSGAGQQAHGWVDLRDGLPGPRVGTEPPVGAGASWPQLGSVLRGDLVAWQRPPYARSADPAPVPVRLAPDPAQVNAFLSRVPVITSPGNASTATGFDWDATSRSMMNTWWYEALTPGGIPLQRSLLTTPAPAAATWGEFAAGDKTVERSSVGLAWFRIYRERAEESADGGFRAGSTFRITVAAGGTRGFRDWAEAAPHGLIDSEATFRSLREAERLMWYRVRWVPQVGGGLDASWQYFPWPAPHMPSHGNNFADTNSGTFGNAGTVNFNIHDRWLTAMMTNLDLAPHHFSNSPMSSSEARSALDTLVVVKQGGSIDWIQRLDAEPDRW